MEKSREWRFNQWNNEGLGSRAHLNGLVFSRQLGVPSLKQKTGRIDAERRNLVEMITSA